MADGYVERFRWGFMPNSTVPYMRSMTPSVVGDVPVEVHSVDEYVNTDLQYLSLLKRPPGGRTLLALVGVQSHQLHRALDLAAHARRNACMVVIGGPHVMTCDTSMLQGRGISFAQAEAELVWPKILHDAASGEMQPVYGRDQRWQQEIEAPVIIPPSRKDLGRYVIPMLGLYPARGCPFLCNFCSVTKIAGRRIRSQSIDTTCLTWRHPSLSRERLSELLFECYRKFFSLRHALRNAKSELRIRSRGLLTKSAANMAMSLFSRYCTWRRTHPMSGGIQRVRLDAVDDFLSLRRDAFGFELAPLPQSLQLPSAELARTPRGQHSRTVASSKAH